VAAGDPFHLAPEELSLMPELFEALGRETPTDLRLERRKVQVVELPVGATEDRVVGSMDLERALRTGERRVEPGLLAQAHRGILYVDEVNLLDDHVVDILLDSAAMGVNTLEREGVSFSHPARFTLVGTMNPEEGELRPQLLDRFGLCVSVEGLKDPADRVEVLERRAAYERDPAGFARRFQNESEAIAEKVERAIKLLPEVSAERPSLLKIANLCLELSVDGHRGDLVVLRAAKTMAALEGRKQVADSDIEAAAELALPHRVRRQPLMEIADNLAAVRRAGGKAKSGD
jgi:magnesium chelatase subunit I